MNLLKLLILASSVLIGLKTFAGVKVVGNGGDAVVCYTDSSKNQIRSVQMFDYWEQEQVLKYGKIDLGPANISVQDKIVIATNRIAKFDPNLSAFVLKNAKNLADNIQSYLANSYILPDIQDSNPKIIPSKPDCFIEQFAIQYKDVQTGQRRFYISEKLYNDVNTSNDDRAGLLLHEAIYRYAILYREAKNSDGVRIFNYVSATKKLETLSEYQLDEYLNILKNSDLLLNKPCVLRDKIYVNWDESLNSFGNITCYNTTVRLNGVSVFIPAGARKSDYAFEFTTQSSSIIQIIIDNFNGKIFKFETNKVSLAKDMTIKIDRIKEDSNTLLPVMTGPQGKLYSCYSFEFDTLANNFKSCWLDEALAPFSFFSSGVNGSWLLGKNGFFNSLKKGIALPVLGSTKGLIAEPNYNTYTSKPIYYTEVDDSLNLIAASTHPQQFFYNDIVTYKQPEIVIGGTKYLIEAFKVNNKNSKYFLTFNSSPMKFDDPKLNGLRLIYSSNNQADSFCTKNGYSNGGVVSTVSTQFVGGQSEQFFDLSNQTIVYKIDEDVEVVKSIRCESVTVETDDY